MSRKQIPADVRGLTRAARFQAISVGECFRGGRDERALLGCGGARSRAALSKKPGLRLKLILTQMGTLAVPDNPRFSPQHNRSAAALARRIARRI
jgi:hypothetical protein